jgi:NADH-quinone oxidoreductase subunit A
VGFYLLVVVLTAAGMLGLPLLLNPRRPSEEKESTYECGVPLFGEARQKVSIKFYVVAILFVLFDIETVFLFPWAVVYRELGIVVVAEMFVFLGVLAFGLLYAWRRGGLEWG